MYEKNDLIRTIRDYIPVGKYNEIELRLNNYYMFYKPYSTLKLACQATFPSDIIANSSQLMQGVSDAYYSAFVAAIVVFVVALACTLNTLQMQKKKSRNIHIALVIEILAHIILVKIYMDLMRVMSEIDIEMYRYLRDN